MAQPLSVSNEAVIAKYRERMSAVLHENLVLSAAVEDLQAQVARQEAQLAAYAARETADNGVVAP